MYKKVKK